MSACIVRLWLVARVRRLALLLAVGGAAALVVSSAAAAQPGASIATVSLHLRFQRVPGDRLVASDRYVFISSNQVAGAAPVGNGVLIDGLTGRRTTILSPDCVSSALGGPWLALTCNPGTNQTFELYNIPTKRFQPLTTAPALAYENCAVDCVPIAVVGADWVAFEAPPGDPEHGVPAFEFQNIQTGEAVSQDPTSSTTTVDLNSPQLRQRVCSPLRVPAVSTAYASGWGSLTFTDGLAIAAGDGGAYLERCGSHQRQFLTGTIPNYTNPLAGCPHLDCPPASNSHAIIWESAAGRLSGLFVSSRQRFTISIPAKVDPQGTSGGFANGDPYQLALTPRTLYLLNSTGQIWSTPAPVQPPACIVPALSRGATVTQLKHLLAAHHCAIGKLVGRRDRKGRAGQVIQLIPRPGTRHPARTRVRILVSTG